MVLKFSNFESLTGDDGWNFYIRSKNQKTSNCSVFDLLTFLASKIQNFYFLTNVLDFDRFEHFDQKEKIMRLPSTKHLLTEFLSSINRSRRRTIRHQLLQILLPRPRGHRHKLLTPMRSILSIHHLRQQELRKRLPLRKNGPLLNGRPKHLHVFRPTHSHLIVRVLRARINRLHHDEDVLELRPNALRCERQCTRFLEDDGHNVVADVALAQ